MLATKKTTHRVAWLALCGLSACIFQHKKQGADRPRPAPKTAETAPDPANTAVKADKMPPKGKKRIAACEGKNGIGEACNWRYEIDESECPEKCSKLVAFFADDTHDCETHDKMLSSYSEKGYFSVCISLFESREAADKMPYSEQALRADAALKEVMASAEVLARWEGGHLLLAGTGYGATVPVIGMARTDLDKGDHWKGILSTGACFFDGIADVFALEEQLRAGAPDGGPCQGRMTASAVEARYAYMPEAKPRDTITGVEATAYTPLHWKLMSCGGELDTCEDDVAPAGPIEQLCTTLSAGDTHLCEYEALPKVRHDECAAVEANRCIEWFDKLVKESS